MDKRCGNCGWWHADYDPNDYDGTCKSVSATNRVVTYGEKTLRTNHTFYCRFWKPKKDAKRK